MNKMRIVRIMNRIKDLGRLGDIAAFEAVCRQATTLDQLKSLVDAIVRQFGFRWFTLVHNVDLKQTTRKALLITTYPARWIEEIMAARLYHEDPVHAACVKTVSGLTWDQIGDYIAPNARQLSILERGLAHGLASGFTMPIRMRDEPDAMFTVARHGNEMISSPDLLSARLVGTVAFDQARALLGPDELANIPIALSPRQIDCLDLVARGKSDWEIGQILGLSRDTVHEYVEAARRRYGVRRRTQLVLRAVRDGHLNIETLV
jgi:DNA-binding CsgD family transcriptional regulator